MKPAGQPSEHWPPPSVRVRKVDGGFVASCLSARPGLGLYDLSVSVVDGVASPVRVRDVFVWGGGVFD